MPAPTAVAQRLGYRSRSWQTWEQQHGVTGEVRDQGGEEPGRHWRSPMALLHSVWLWCPSRLTCLSHLQVNQWGEQPGSTSASLPAPSPSPCSSRTSSKLKLLRASWLVALRPSSAPAGLRGRSSGPQQLPPLTVLVPAAGSPSAPLTHTPLGGHFATPLAPQQLPSPSISSWLPGLEWPPVSAEPAGESLPGLVKARCGRGGFSLWRPGRVWRGAAGWAAAWRKWQ